MSRFDESAPPKGEFSFDFCKRNDELVKKGLKPSSYLESASTIVGLVFEDGVIIGADTRATEGSIVALKNCEKIRCMAPNIYCCGAGTAADIKAVTDMVSSHLKLHSYHTGRESMVVTAMTLLKSRLLSYQGHLSAALMLCGVDVTGPHLHTVYPDGYTDSVPFATMGSGSLAAMAILESQYCENLTREEGLKMVIVAICSGIFNDLGSGSNVDICVITKGEQVFFGNLTVPNPPILATKSAWFSMFSDYRHASAAFSEYHHGSTHTLPFATMDSDWFDSVLTHGPGDFGDGEGDDEGDFQEITESLIASMIDPGSCIRCTRGKNQACHSYMYAEDERREKEYTFSKKEVTLTFSKKEKEKEKEKEKGYTLIKNTEVLLTKKTPLFEWVKLNEMKTSSPEMKTSLLKKVKTSSPNTTKLTAV